MDLQDKKTSRISAHLQERTRSWGTSSFDLAGAEVTSVSNFIERYDIVIRKPDQKIKVNTQSEIHPLIKNPGGNQALAYH